MSGTLVGGGKIAATYCDFSSYNYSLLPGNQTGNLYVDPLFVNGAAGDVHLQPGSPCVGTGTVAGAPLLDKDGKLRFSPPSIGAYELTGAPVWWFF